MGSNEHFLCDIPDASNGNPVLDFQLHCTNERLKKKKKLRTHDIQGEIDRAGFKTGEEKAS